MGEYKEGVVELMKMVQCFPPCPVAIGTKDRLVKERSVYMEQSLWIGCDSYAPGRLKGRVRLGLVNVIVVLGLIC